MTFTSAARAIGWRPAPDGSYSAAGRRLRRLCLAREAEVDRRFILRDRRGQPRAVTLGALARYLPELRPSQVDALAGELRAAVADRIDDRVRQVVHELTSTVGSR